MPSWDTTDTICMLDINLFPLFSQLLWGDSLSQTIGCGRLWSDTTFFLSFVVFNDGDVKTWNPAMSPKSLFCSRRGKEQCVYSARSSSRLTNLDADDSIASITGNLNKLLKAAGNVVSASATRDGSTRTYEYVNRCAAMLMEKLLVTQADIQTAYGTLGPSGLYYSFRLTLYEIPLSWIHHAMLVTLLSTIDKTVEAPILNDQMGLGQISLPLWSDGEERSRICDIVDELNARPLLWKIICLNVHPEYTFSLDREFLMADKLALDIQEQAQTDIQNNLLTNDGNMGV